MKNRWKKLDSKLIYENPWLRLREDTVIRPDGKKGIYGVVQFNPAVFVVALTEASEIYLIELYRYTIKQSSWEIPAGSIDNQSPLKAAKRELLEETGLVAKKWISAGSHYGINGACDHLSHVFIAQKLEQTGHNEQKEEGIDRVKKVPFKKVLQMISEGKITDGETIAALLMAGLQLKLL